MFLKGFSGGVSAIVSIKTVLCQQVLHLFTRGNYIYHCIGVKLLPKVEFYDIFFC